MLRSILSVLALLITFSAFAQTDNIHEITPQIEKKITAEVNKAAEIFKAQNKDILGSEAQLAFAMDTFKIEHIAQKKMEVNFSTHGMNDATYEATEAYDKLLNKYYNKLLALLKPEDKKTLITAQKAWLTFRNTEQTLIEVISAPQYSGGGTMQSNINTSSYNELIKQRTIQIFNHYDRASTAK